MSLNFVSEETKLSIERIKELEKRLEDAQKEVGYYQEKIANLMNEIVGLDNRLDRIRKLIWELQANAKDFHGYLDDGYSRFQVRMEKFSDEIMEPLDRLKKATEK